MKAVKRLLPVVLVLMSAPSYAAGGFQTHFNAFDFAFVAGLAAFIALLLYVMNHAARALRDLESKEGDLPAWQGRLKSVLEEVVQAKTVIFYCSLIFLSFYTMYAFVRGTSLESHVVEWLNLVVRWTHVVFGIAWIGASFYFNFLENSLNRTKGLREGIAGNLWAVHGGGFYYLEKYKTAPPEIPKDLHWFKYEAYFTWLSGFTLLIIVYYLDAKVYLIDPAVMDISSTAAVGIGIGTLIGGWLVYDTLCKSVLSAHKILFALILLVFTSAVAWMLSHVFSSRAAYIHVGAMLGTLMVGNVFRVIIPSQKAMVKAAKEGRAVDPSLGKKALLRSLHNNYFTLPVIFIMISNHFPSTYGGAFNWLVLIGLSVTSVVVKHYLNLMEKGEKAVWILPVAVVGMIALALVTAPHTKSVCKDDSAASFAEVNAVITKRCVQCHSSNPTDDILKTAPNGIMFDKPENILKYADRIMNRAVITKTMPQGNKTHITQEERDIIQCWVEHGSKP
ncbi:MAG TPA: urate hydroxylase PuuD [Bacteroidia bacterium]|nr:urate hydroxylase PuuD [Bacteroidia bacterium]